MDLVEWREGAFGDGVDHEVADFDVLEGGGVHDVLLGRDVVGD